MRKKLDTHEQLVIEQLKDAEFAAEYLNEHWSYQGPRRMEHLLRALHRVALARGISKVARESGISRRALHKIFSEDGNPTAESLLAILDTFGVSVRFDTARKRPVGRRARAAA